MTNQKQLNKYELFCVIYKTLELKIKNHTLDDIFESVTADVDDDKHNLFIHFKNSSICLSLDSERIYEFYKCSNDLFKTIKAIVKLAQEQYDELKDTVASSDEPKDIFKLENIYVQVVPYDTEYFADKIAIPLPFDNKLYVMFRCFLRHDQAGIKSIPITKDIYNLYFSEYTLDELLKISCATTRKLFPLRIEKMSYALRLGLVQQGYSPKEIEDYIAHNSKHNFLYMVTTDVSHYGANIFLFPELMHAFSQEIDSSFFILPGSTREIYFASELNPVKDNWLSTIKGANQIAPEDFLSDHLYYYDINTGNVSIYK